MGAAAPFMPMSFDGMVRRMFVAARPMRIIHPTRWIAPRLILLLSLFILLPAGAATYSPAEVPNPKTHGNGYVANPDGILSAEVVATLNAQLGQLERDTGAQVAVVAIGDTDPHDIFDFAHALFEHWGIGDKDRDDGLLMLLVKNQRTIRLHTGYGLEGTLPDVVCKRIQDGFMVPEFKRGDYGAGLIAGVEQVSQRLREPAHASQFAGTTLNAQEEGARLFRYMLMGILSFTGLVAFGIKSAYGYFSGSRRLAATPPAMRYSRKRWALLMLGLPALIILGAGQLPLDSPFVLTLAAVYLYFLLMNFVQIRRQRKHVANLYSRHNYTAITRFLQRQRGFWRWMAFLFPLPFAAYPFLLGRRIAFYRNHPRQCPKCGKPMQRQSEEHEDAYLSSGQQVEESIHAMDHDVWLCEACGRVDVRSFTGRDEDDFKPCPACKHLTYWQESDITLVEADYSHGGTGERTFECKHCKHREVIGYTTARLTRSSSSSSSGGSSGGSFGGGSSGGGGSSSSW